MDGRHQPHALADHHVLQRRRRHRLGGELRLLASYGGEHADSIIRTFGIAGVSAAAVFGLGVYVALRLRRKRAEDLVEGAAERAEARKLAPAAGSVEE